MIQHPLGGSVYDNSSDNLFAANYAHLLCLIVEQGTDCMRRYVLDNLPSPVVNFEVGAEEGGVVLESKLKILLSERKKHFRDLRKRNKINKVVYEQLYPPHGMPVNVAKFDMSAWYVLARNLAVNEPRVNYNQYERATPSLREQLPQHNIIRIRKMRNVLFHMDSPQLDTCTFDIMWQETEKALLALRTDQEVITDYKHRDLDPFKTLKHYSHMREQMHEEFESLYKTEMKKRKHILVALAIVTLLLIGVTVASSYILYRFTAKWKSCLPSMKTKMTSSGTVRIMPRKGWKAKPAKSYNPPLNLPLEYVIISHTAVVGRCSTTDDCCNTAQVAQEVSWFHGFDDVAYNYMVGNDGVIYEGRGLKESATAFGWNSKSIGIGFMGKYVLYPPTDDALDVTQVFLQYLVDSGVLTHNFTLYGLCQVRSKFPDAPGASLYRIIQSWRGEGINNPWRWRSRPGSNCNTNLTYADLLVHKRPRDVF